jgi:hypothetical protein
MKNMLPLFLYLLCLPAAAQFSLRPYLGVNSTAVDSDYGYFKGGNFMVSGIEVEWSRNQKSTNEFSLSVASGLGYLNNGYYDRSSIKASTILYVSNVSNLKTKLIQLPLILRVNWQPFPLVESWKIFVGLGLNYNFLIDASLDERYVLVEYTDDFFALPKTTSYSDRLDFNDVKKTTNLFRRIEIGAKYKRFQFAYRISVSLQDTYFTGIEDNWAVPDENSRYISSHTEFGQRKEKHTELCLGYKIF